ncbi:MAG TPA: SDR family oxidoreductase [Bryobacterales bacterium]|nr:SDR family oxidoreductase [Bryobacterales bacterium]
MFREAIFRDRVAIITGGGTGLGRAFALRFSELGARVTLASRDPAHLEPACDEIRRRGGEALAVPTDVRLPEQVENMVRRTVERFGRLDILVNNAAGNFLCQAEKLSYNGWRAVVDIVLNGTFYCSRAALEAMKGGGYGRILNILAAYAAGASPGTVHSCAAKAGVLAMTRTLAVEWARYNIHVNAVAPGSFPTEGASSRLMLTPGAAERALQRIPAGRVGRHEELANLAAYLCSDYADYINGESVTIDGGASWNHPSFEWENL